MDADRDERLGHIGPGRQLLVSMGAERQRWLGAAGGEGSAAQVVGADGRPLPSASSSRESEDLQHNVGVEDLPYDGEAEDFNTKLDRFSQEEFLQEGTITTLQKVLFRKI